MSKGNEYAHGVLRGYLEEGGAATRNCDYEHLSEICDRFAVRNVEILRWWWTATTAIPTSSICVR